MEYKKPQFKKVDDMKDGEVKYIEKPEDFNDIDTEDLHLTDEKGNVLFTVNGKDQIKEFLKNHYDFNNKVNLKSKLKQKIKVMEDIRNNKL